MKTSAESYRKALKVTAVRYIGNMGAFPVCPRCQKTLEREYQRFCDRCGQRLNWVGYSKATVISEP